jgi:acyl carrier protein
MENIEKKVVDLISEVLVDVNPESIKMDSKIVEDLGAESLDIYDMIALIEEKFDVEISDDQVEQIQTVQDVANYLKEATAS